MTTPAERFYCNMMDLSKFIRHLVEKLNKNGNYCLSSVLVNIAEIFLSGLDKKILIEGFINNSYTLWEEVRNKNQDILNQHSDIIFGNVPGNYAPQFQEMFSAKKEDGSLIVDDSDRETIWKYLHSFVKQAIRYVHEVREPYSDEQGNLRYHRKLFFDPPVNVDIKACSEKWNMNRILTFPPKEK